MAKTLVKVEDIVNVFYLRTTKEWYCGFGDGVHDGAYYIAKTKEKAILRFIAGINSGSAGFCLALER